MTPLDRQSSDATLVSAILGGNREAFVLLVERYERPLRAAARSRLGRDDWADDVVQETFLCLLKWLRTYDARFSFRTWLWTVLLNQCSRHAQKQARHSAAPLERQPDSSCCLPAELLASHEASPVEELLAAESRGKLHGLLARLPQVQADALRLRFFGGLKFQEIAEAMECSLTTAKGRVKQGLLQLSQWLREEGASVDGKSEIFPVGRGDA
jgi:RNA polymerase sigma-70 factor (ECF subfamily)